MIKARFRKLAAIALAFLLGLVLCEGALRLVGFALLASADRGAGSAGELGPDGKLFLCLGDSNTFGLWVDAADSYPSRLQELLDERVAGGPHRVVNLGIPGLNSRQVRKRCIAALEDFDADGVLVLAGFNDRWSWVPDSDGDDVVVDQPWYEDLRLAKLLRIASGSGTPEREREAEEPEESLRMGVDRFGREYTVQRVDLETPREDVAVRRALVQSLRAMCAGAERARTPIYLLTYASGRDAYALASGAAREVSQEYAAGLIDPRAWFRAQDVIPRDEILFPDGHPREPGYELFARLVFNGLIEQHAIEAEPLELLADDLISCDESPVLHIDLEGARVSLRRERPGRRFALLLCVAGEGPAAVFNGVELPLVDDQLFRITRNEPGLRGEIKRDGGGSVSIAKLLDQKWLSGRTLRFVSVSWNTVDPRDPKLSTPIEFLVP